MSAAEAAQAALRRRAAADHPGVACACADIDAFERAEGVGSPAEAEALKRRDPEAWIPGLAARPAVIAMSWAIAAAVAAGAALSWLPSRPWLEAAGDTAEIAGCAVAAAAAAWGILSEVRGWEGSDASRWLLKRRVKAFSRALAARRSAVCEALVVVDDDAITVYRVEDGAVVAHPCPAVRHVAIEPEGDHMALRIRGPDGERLLEWLRRDAGFEAAVERFSRGAAGAPAAARPAA